MPVNKHIINLYESFDKTLPISRNETKLAYIADEWEFQMGSRDHIVRFEHAGKRFGQRAIAVKFGIKKGRGISTKLQGVTDIRLYLATVFKALEMSIEDPTRKMKSKMEGFVLVIPNKFFDKYGSILSRILRRKFMGRYEVNMNYNEFPYNDTFSAFYLTKLGKRFDKVFSMIPEPEMAPEPETDINVPVEQPETQPMVFPKAFEEEQPVEIGGTRIKDKYNLAEAEEAWYKVYFYTNLTASAFSMSEKPKPVNKKDFELSAWFQSQDRHPELEEKKLLAALSMNGIFTDHIYSFNPSKTSYISNDYLSSMKPSFVEAVFLNLKKTNHVNSSNLDDHWSRIYPIMKNYESEFEQALGRFGIHTYEQPKYSKKRKDTIRYGAVDMSNYSIEELYDMFDTAATELHQFNIPNEDLMKVVEEGEGKWKKEKLRHKYISELQEEFGVPSLSSIEVIREAIRRRATSADQIYELEDKLPPFAQDNILSPDNTRWTASFLGSWLMTGGSEAYSVSGNGAKNVGVNSEFITENFWIHNKGQGSELKGFSATMLEEVYSHSRIQSQFTQMYDQTQIYYREKLGKKYDGYKFKLYRGIGVDDVTTYIPAPMESWSRDKSTGNRFAKMMAKGKYSQGTVMYAEVPVQYIMCSFESHEIYWASEDHLKGKKEYVVMGGAFNTVPIYEYDRTAKELVTNRSLSFAEFLQHGDEYMTEEVNKGKQIKIVPPSKKGSKTGLGVDPNEYKTKGSDKPK